MNVLLVDDEIRMLDLLELFLENFTCTKAASGKEALALIEQHAFDLVILDVMMPEMDGWTTCAKIRKITNVPIIMLTAKNGQDDIVRGLTGGADDYLTKPFSEKVLLARIEAVLRRTKRQTEIHFHGLIWNKEKHTLHINDRETGITPSEFELLGVLLNHQDQVLARDQLIEKIWGFDADIDTRTVDSHMRNLRNRLKKAGFPVQNYLQTVYGVGYKWSSKGIRYHEKHFV
ncbi:response regulator transcription factor [Bacillus sonorensis]|uniref:response regulator transcription factor n=1 Tax=Bacillus sonorensis TaxID=119858 RepID=UPI002280B151|nr:response regulator transcription factor [Bacillus sonorensis]MCZ0069691.1 response regulator transcription factor [Bacillus sonorensis]MCZ0097080.1 response regulator transcription factor [Bacillus sonorensis]MEC1501564.1 response regulator transcription factor [Bacillus sonorensis]MEC1517758.1 response regulator transcription factor [Bacillus sonorensis]